MTVMTIGFSFLFPLVFASDIVVDPLVARLRGRQPGVPDGDAIRGLMGSGASLNQICAALIAPILLTLLLAPTTLWLYRRQ